MKNSTIILPRKAENENKYNFSHYLCQDFINFQEYTTDKYNQNYTCRHTFNFNYMKAKSIMTATGCKGTNQRRACGISRGKSYTFLFFNFECGHHPFFLTWCFLTSLFLLNLTLVPTFIPIFCSNWSWSLDLERSFVNSNTLLIAAWRRNRRRGSTGDYSISNWRCLNNALLLVA